MRIQHKREYYYPAAARVAKTGRKINKARKVTHKHSTAVAYVWEEIDPNRDNQTFYFAALFGGKRQKPDDSGYSKTEQRRERFVADHFRSVQSSEEFKAQYKAEQTSKGRGLDVGDILKSVWGYDQTNVDYYQVTKLVGKTMVEIRPIAADSEADAWMQGESTPKPGAFTGKATRHRAKDGSVKIASYAYARKMQPKQVIDGTPIYAPTRWTSYA